MKAVDAIIWSVGGLAGSFGLLLVLASSQPPSWEEEPVPPVPPPVAPGVAPEASPREEAPSTLPRPRLPTPPPPLPDTYLDRVGARQEFSRSDVEGQIGLSYGFVDHHGKTHRIYCEISKKDHERESARYGYDQAEIEAQLGAQMQRYLENELQARGLAPYIQLTVAGGHYSAQSHLPPMADDAERARILSRINEFFGSFWKEQLPRRRTAFERALFEQHGLSLANDVWGPYYEQLATRARPLVGDCYRALARAGDGYHERQLLGLFVAFLQEIKYELPPDVVGRRQTSGLWVPTEVLVGDHGDCDSKSTAFASLWLNVGAPLILIDLPEHMLVGVEVRPAAGERYVLVRNRYFVICEVAGPGKWHPGAAGPATLAGVSGHFSYTMLEPAAAARAANAGDLARP